MSPRTRKRARRIAVKHTGSTPRRSRVDAIELLQSSTKLYLFKAKASTLYNSLSINRRVEGKEEGYQRALSVSRVQSITRFVTSRKVLPGAIIVTLDGATYNSRTKKLTLPAGSDIGWVIDGQHRLVGAAMASRGGIDVELPVVAFLDLPTPRQIEQFVTINREAKSVPTSLYLDLLRALPYKKPADVAKERAADLATELRRSEESPFFERIVVTTSPRAGQLSLTNFVRKIAPHVTPERGILNVYTEPEQRAVISNYFNGLRQVFLKEYDSKDSIFFKTIGFGGLWNAFPTFFSLAIKHYHGFQVKDVIALFKTIDNFDFSAWKQYGTGNQAELTAGDDLRTGLLLAIKDEESGTLRV